jgi:hypothetical protein
MDENGIRVDGKIYAIIDPLAIATELVVSSQKKYLAGCDLCRTACAEVSLCSCCAHGERVGKQSLAKHIQLVPASEFIDAVRAAEKREAA